MIKSLAVALVLVHWISAPAMAIAWSQSPKTAEDYNNRGLERQNRGDLDGAIADYTKTIELDPTHALAYANRGVVKALLKKPDASADFEAAFRLNPSLRATYSEFYEKRRKP